MFPDLSSCILLRVFLLIPRNRYVLMYIVYRRDSYYGVEVLSNRDFDFVEFRHDSKMLMRAWHCARCSVTSRASFMLYNSYSLWNNILSIYFSRKKESLNTVRINNRYLNMILFSKSSSWV